MTNAQLLTLTLGLAVVADTGDDYGRLCWRLQRGALLWPGDYDRLYAHEWIAARVREIDSEALARHSLAMEGSEVNERITEPCGECGSIDCDGFCYIDSQPEPPYCGVCGGVCTGSHPGEDDDEV